MSEKNWVSGKEAKEQKTAGNEKRKACKHPFKYPSQPITPLTSKETISHVKLSKWAVQEGFTHSPCLFGIAREKPSDWPKRWRKLSKLTNHRVYQEVIPRWSIKNNAHRLHYPVSLFQAPTPFLRIFRSLERARVMAFKSTPRNWWQVSWKRAIFCKTRSNRSFSGHCLMSIYCASQRFPSRTHLRQPLIKSSKKANDVL